CPGSLNTNGSASPMAGVTRSAASALGRSSEHWPNIRRTWLIRSEAFPAGTAGPLIRPFANAKAHLLPRGEKGPSVDISAYEPPSPLVGEGLGVRGPAMPATWVNPQPETP